MFRYALFAFGASFAVGLPQAAVAQTTIIQPVVQVSGTNGSCYNPNTDGATNASALPLCQEYLDQVPGGDQYDARPTDLADTRPCPAGANCGPEVEYSNFKPFYGNGVQPVPASTIVTPPPAPVVLAPPPPPVAVAAAPAASPALFAPVQVLPTAGLGTLGVVGIGLVSALAVGGVIALSDNDSSSDTQ